MNRLFSTLTSTPQPQSPAPIIHKLNDRLKNSTLFSDKLSSIKALKSLARENKPLIDASLLFHLLDSEQDPTLLADILEILLTLSETSEEDSKSVEFRLKFLTSVSTTANFEILVRLLKQSDFYVLYNLIQFLLELVKKEGSKETEQSTIARIKLLQDTIMNTPLGIATLIDLLDDKREMIRNEAMLLIYLLQAGNFEIQKLFAFENLFERVFGILREEGGFDGGVVALDCLKVVDEMLGFNVSNQNYFRENSFVQRFPPLFNTINDTPWENKQKEENVNLAVNIIRGLVGKGNSSRELNQNVILSSSLFSTLLNLSVSTKKTTIPASVRASILRVLGDVIFENDKCSDYFSLEKIGGGKGGKDGSEGPPKPVILAILQIVFDEREEYIVRVSATYCIKCYLMNNPDNQMTIASTITPPPPDNPNSDLSENPTSPGSLILDSLFKPTKSWFSSVLLFHVLVENLRSKKKLLEYCGEESLDTSNDDEKVSLLHQIMYNLITLSHPTSTSSESPEKIHNIKVGYFMIVAGWLIGFEDGVKEFLSDAANLQFLISQIIQTSGSDVIIQGLSAYVLGLLIEYNNDLEPGTDRATIQALVKNRIGVDIFMSKLERLRESTEFNKTEQSLLNEKQELVFDYSFIELFKDTYHIISKSVLNLKSKSPKRNIPNQTDAEIAKLKEKNRLQEIEIKEWKLKCEKLERISQITAKVVGSTTNQSASGSNLEAEYLKLQEKYAGLEKEMDDLLVCLAEQDAENEKLKLRLKSYGEVFESEEENDEEEEPEVEVIPETQTSPARSVDARSPFLQPQSNDIRPRSVSPKRESRILNSPPKLAPAVTPVSTRSPLIDFKSLTSSTSNFMKENAKLLEDLSIEKVSSSVKLGVENLKSRIEEEGRELYDGVKSFVTREKEEEEEENLEEETGEYIPGRVFVL